MTHEISPWDMAVIGAGIAGASVAYELAATCRVLVLEMEDQPGYHTTGRSAASFSEILGTPLVRALSAGSRPFFEAPPEGFSETPLWSGLKLLLIADAGRAARVEDLFRATKDVGPGPVLTDADEARRLAPLLRPEAAARGVFDAHARALDVDAILQGYLRGLRRRGGELVTGAEVRGLSRHGALWRIETRAGTFEAGKIVNAGGAWADTIAILAGVRPLGLTPLRRTAFTFDPPAGAPESPRLMDWPMIVDIDERFYVRPETGLLLASPCDETPSPPCDAQPEELDVARGVERIEAAFDLRVSRIRHKWAGLRTFARDRRPVTGDDGQVEGFFWLAGQGGTGIQTAPAAARFAAALALGQPIPDDLAALGLDPKDVAPDRLA